MPRHSNSTCSVCGFTCSRPYDLKRHKKTHDPSRIFAFPCTVCGKKFAENSNLTAHLRLHGIEIPYTRKRPRKYTPRKRGKTKETKVTTKLKRDVDAIAAVQKQLGVLAISQAGYSSGSDSHSVEENTSTMPCAFYTMSCGHQSDFEESDSDSDTSLPVTPVSAFNNNVELYPESHQAYSYSTCIDPRLISPYSSEFAPEFSVPTPAYTYDPHAYQSKQWIPAQARSAVPMSAMPMYGLASPINYGPSVQYNYVEHGIPCTMEEQYKYAGQGFDGQQLEPSFTPSFNDLESDGNIFSYIPAIPEYNTHFENFGYDTYVNGMFGSQL
ncbi:hypothetical protein BDN70DRAFT_964104 [Pholiota conissans]|uniref:C2H2-type domain-containing protein n=1 Tax=Pholiota conissans TaxID=109636 RepID=A0A9P5YQK6_9AGAR|nr:hypothetical protein BDN70DRAFT_964104 [Pholiota conissans]